MLLPPAPPARLELRKGRGHLFAVRAAVTEPVSDLSLTVANPFGYDDAFHVGDVTVAAGNAFACSPEARWRHRRDPAPSGLSVMRAEVSYSKLINREGEAENPTGLF